MNRFYYPIWFFGWALFEFFLLLWFNPVKINFFDLYPTLGFFKAFCNSNILQNIPALFFYLYGKAAYLIPILFICYALFIYIQASYIKIRIVSGYLLLQLTALFITLKKYSFGLPFYKGGIIGNFWSQKIQYLPLVYCFGFVLICSFFQKEGLFVIKKIFTFLNNKLGILYHIQLVGKIIKGWIFYGFPFIKLFFKKQSLQTTLIEDIINQEIEKEYRRLYDFAGLLDHDDDNIDDSKNDYRLVSDLIKIIPSRSKPYKNEEHEDVLIYNFFKIMGISIIIKESIVGPFVTRYLCEIPLEVRVNHIENLMIDLQKALGKNNIIMESASPHKNSLYIIVPLQKPHLILLTELLVQSSSKDIKMPLILGSLTDGKVKIVDMADLPHLLIAGTTGSGKSMLIHSCILSLLWNHYPTSLKFVLIDPKRLEFAFYQSLPHLLYPVLINPDEILEKIIELIDLMNQRYEELSLSKVRSIKEYHEINKLNEEKMPYLVIIIDEYADLKMQNHEIEKHVVRLCQMGRACGIHLIIATQRPSADVISGVIKANISSRCALRVSSSIDSRIILDQSGAEQLLGKGDMLFLSPSGSLERVHGAFVTIKEIEDIVNLIIKQQVFVPIQDPLKISSLK